MPQGYADMLMHRQLQAGVSVIMPVYNAERFIDDTLQCLQRQTFTDYELLIIDDGSTDNTLPKLRQAAESDARIRLLTQRNKGVSAARNTAIGIATREYLTFIDHDDLITDDYLETLVSNMRGFDLCVSGSYSIYREDYHRKGFESRYASYIREAIEAPDFDALAEQWHRFDRIPSVLATVWPKLFRTEIIQSNGLTFPSSMAEDHIFSYRYMLHISSMRQIAWGGYYHVFSRSSLGNSHKYIADLDCIHEMQQLYERLIARFGVSNETYFANLRWRSLIRYASLAMKGYHSDTRTSRRERLKVWRSIAKDKWFRHSRMADTGRVRRLQFLILACRTRAFYLLDAPLAYWMKRRK